MNQEGSSSGSSSILFKLSIPQEAVGLGLLLMVSFALTAPVPEPQNGRQVTELQIMGF